MNVSRNLPLCIVIGALLNVLNLVFPPVERFDRLATGGTYPPLRATAQGIYHRTPLWRTFVAAEDWKAGEFHSSRIEWGSLLAYSIVISWVSWSLQLAVDRWPCRRVGTPPAPTGPKGETIIGCPPLEAPGESAPIRPGARVPRSALELWREASDRVRKRNEMQPRKPTDPKD